MDSSFMVENEYDFANAQNNNFFSFMHFGNEEGSPLSSPFLQEDGISHGGSDLSSPDVSSPDYAEGLPTSLFFSDPLQSLLMGEPMQSEEFLIEQPIKTELSSEVKIAVEEKKEKKGRGKKRARSNAEESTDVSAVVLSREQILSFSSEDLDKFIADITNIRPLTYAEEKELKKQRRLIKNRESAQASRQRKKVYVDELEAEIAKLKNQNTHLSSQVGALVTENRTLREELQKLHTLVKKTGLVVANAFTSKSEKPNDASHVGGSPQQKAKAGVVLLILLFSFGLFFNVDKGPARSLLGSGIPQIIGLVPGMVAGPLSNMAGVTNAPARRLLETDSKHTEPIMTPHQSLLKEKIVGIQTSYQSKVPVHKIPINNGESKRQGATIGTPASPYEEIDNHKRIVSEKVPDEHNTQSQFMAGFAEMMNDSINQNVSELHDAEMQQWFAERLKLRPNTAFFSVTDFQQIIPPNMQPFDSNSPFFVSLLVPARSFANQLPASSNHVVDNTMVEVTCQVVAVNQTNLDLDEVNKIRQVPVMA